MDEHDTFAVIHRRRSVRAYTSDRIDEATVRRLLDAAVHAPTAAHLEPWAFVVVQDRALLARLSERARQMDSEEEHIFHDAGTLIVICALPKGPSVAADCWLAAENLMLAACALGLGTCAIGLAVPVLDDPEVRQELGIPPEVTVVAPIVVGVPRGPVPAVARRPPQVLRWLR